MKRISSKITFAFILSLILFVSLFAISAFAVTPIDGDITWKYTLNDTDNTATITGATISASVTKTPSFTIPDTIDVEKNGEVVSYTVTAISNNAFNGNKKVFGTLTLPSTLKTIGNNAFSSTYISGDLVIPDSVETIGESAFANCLGLYHVKLSESVTTLQKTVFYKCYSLVEINTGKVVTFNEGCFQDCSSLLNIDLASAETLGKNAFLNCFSFSGTYDLSKVDNLTASAFNNCKRITGFIIPDSYARDLNANANNLLLFTGCISLEKVLVNSNNNYKSIDGVLFSSDEKTLIYYPFAKSGSVYKLPSKVTKIADYAFRNATELDRVILPETIKEIGVGAFNSSSILDFYVPDGIKTIGVDTFKGCSKIQWVVIGTGVTTIGVDAFASVNTSMVLYNKNDALARPNGSFRTYVLVSEYQCVNHRYGYLDVSPTCEEYGYNKCVICNRLSYIKERGHAGPIIKKGALSCTTDEYSVVKCITCKQEVTIISQKCNGHISSFVTTAKTDTTPGYVIGTCAVCRETYLESFTPHKDIACASHKNITSIVIGESSCKTNGLELIYCGDCGILVEAKITSKLTCNYIKDTEIRSTCTVNGQLIEICTICSSKKYTTLPLAEHKHSWYTVSESFGFEYSSCAVCGIFESREVDYSVFNSLLAQVSKYYEIYYAPDTVAMLKPIIDNKDMNLTQEAVDYNSKLLSNILSNIKYNVKDIPVIFIEKGAGALEKENYTDAKLYIAYKENGEYKVEAVDHNGLIKIRGNSTANSTKYPYNIKFSSNTDLFDMGAGKKYSLLANLYDQTLIRNAIAMDFAHAIGLENTSKYVMVELYYNGEYDGVYMLTTPVDVGENRVDIDEDNDFLLEILSNHGDDNDSKNVRLNHNGLLSDFKGLNMLVESQEEMELSAEAYSKLISSFNQISFAIYSGDWNKIQEWVDVESMAKFYLLHDYLKAVDIGYDSTQFYIKDGKLYGGPVWDWDFAIGNKSTGGGQDGGSWSAYNNTGTYSTTTQGVTNDGTTGFWANSLWHSGATGYFIHLYKYSPEFIELVASYVKEYDDEMTLLYEDIVISRNETLVNTIDKFYKDEAYTAARIRNWTIYTFSKKYGVDQLSGDDGIISYNHAINHLRDWLERRHDWLKSAYDA